MSRLLVDTHALLWGLSGDPSLPPRVRDAIADPENEPLVSTASVLEVAIKSAIGKLTASDDLLQEIVEVGYAWLDVTPAHAWRVRELPLHHRDPFDRVLIAQALIEGLPVITADPRFAAYGVDVRW